MGFGDEIMTTGFARLAKKKHPEAQIVIGDLKKNYFYDNIIFKNNPNITDKKNYQKSKKTICLNTYPGQRPYVKSWNEKRIFWNENFKTIRGDLYFDKKELLIAKKAFDKILNEWESKTNKNFQGIVFIEPSRKDKEYSTDNKKNFFLGERNKCWINERWQEVIDSLKNEILFIQTIHSESSKLDGTFKFKSDFRTACALMSFCDCFLGWEGGFSHAAAALNKKAVVLFGGWIHPRTTGYDLHSNIYIDIEGSPCGMRDSCKHCEECRNLITTKEVISRLNKIL